MLIPKIRFTFVMSNQKGHFSPIFIIMDTKDRIRLIMESQHMTQQVFADFLEQSPATLSSIFNGRTRPTLNIVDAIKTKIPDINIEWLLYGTGDMYLSSPQPSDGSDQGTVLPQQDLMFDFENSSSPSSTSHSRPVFSPSGGETMQGVKSTHPESVREIVKIVDKEPRTITEIRVYYSDQTYESFTPSKK